MNRTINFTYNRNSATMSRRKMLLAGCFIAAFFILFSLIFITKTVTAQRSSERIKLVTSVQVKNGDSLWSIASQYFTEDYDDMHEYIDEIVNSNGLTTDTIHAGNFIIVPYYADASR